MKRNYVRAGLRDEMCNNIIPTRKKDSIVFIFNIHHWQNIVPYMKWSNVGLVPGNEMLHGQV